jgi:tetratricopeptide (TPR) repeat protein
VAFRRSKQEIDKLLANANRARSSGDRDLASYLTAEAALVLTEEGRASEAIELYIVAHEYGSAAELAAKTGDFDQAARLFFRAGDLVRAAEAKLALGEDVLAAELLEQGGEFARAGEIHEKNKDLPRAGNLYEKAGDKARAAEVYTRAITGQGVPSLLGPGAQEICRRAGVLFTQVGRIADAVQVLRYGGQLAFAGKLLIDGGRFDEAALLLEAAGEIVLAAEACRKAGKEQRASMLLAQRDEAEGRLPTAASYYEHAGAYAEAARCYELSNDFLRAAIASEKAGLLGAAARLYERLGQWEHAKRCYEIAGMVREIESLAERTGGGRPQAVLVGASVPGEIVRAASRLIALAREGDRDRYPEGIELLFRVEPDAPEYPRARTLLAEVFEEQGEHRSAWEVLHELFRRTKPSIEHVPALYQYARALEREGYLAEARNAFRTAAELDPSFKDARVRVGLMSNTSPGAPIPRLSAPQLSMPEIAIELPVESPPRSESGELHPTDLLGVTLHGRFRIEEKLGSGSQAIVYRARDVILDRFVAIKIFASSQLIETDGVERFLREVRLAARVHHPNCIGVYDFGHERSLTFMAMEFFEGITLAKMIQSGPIAPLDAVRIATQVARALGAVHAAGIVHRDVKPANIMINSSGDVRLTDFGVAKHVEEETSTGLMIGTIAYMAPEQAGGKRVDARTDVFSLGVLIYEMIAGRKPWPITLDALARRIKEPPPRLDPQCGAPEGLREIVERCMQPKPENRYQLIEPVILGLEAIWEWMEDESPGGSS